jgi:two-component system phosphate regulon sensor histidine kinase PhoR
MWHSRTFWRLFGTFGTLLLTSIGVLGTVVADRVERDYLRQVEETLRTKAILVREILRDRPADYPARLQEHFHRLRQETVTRITLLAPDGRVLADTDEDPAQMENHADRPEVRAAQEAGFGASVRYSHTLGQSMMYAALRAPADSGGVGYVRVALPLSDVRGQLAGLRRIVWTAAAVIGLAVLALAFWPARRLTRPLDELVRGAQRLVAGEHTRKIDLTAAGEVGTLARSFNALSDQLAAQVKQVEADRQQLRAVLGGMVEGVVALDADARILFMNGRAAELLDLAAPAAVGRKFWEMVRQPNLQDVVRQALAGPEPSRQELTWPGPVPRHLTVHASRLPGGPARGAVLVLHDTTELRRLERLRQEFVANVSHELKTPLAVIKASLETLLGGALADPEFGQRFLQRAVAQADRLNMLILDLLSLARIEAGDELFEFQAVALAPVVAECLERHRERAEGKRLTG